MPPRRARDNASGFALVPSSNLLALDDLPDANLQSGDVPLDRIPEDVQVKDEIGMCNEITQSRYLTPSDIWIPLPQIEGKIFHRLPGNMEVEENPVESQLVREGLIAHQAFGVTDNLGAARLNVLQE